MELKETCTLRMIRFLTMGLNIRSKRALTPGTLYQVALETYPLAGTDYLDSNLGSLIHNTITDLVHLLSCPIRISYTPTKSTGRLL